MFIECKIDETEMRLAWDWIKMCESGLGSDWNMWSQTEMCEIELRLDWNVWGQIETNKTLEIESTQFDICEHILSWKISFHNVSECQIFNFFTLPMELRQFYVETNDIVIGKVRLYRDQIGAKWTGERLAESK